MTETTDKDIDWSVKYLKKNARSYDGHPPELLEMFVPRWLIIEDFKRWKEREARE